MHMAGSANLSAIGVSRSTTETSCTPAGQEAGMAGAGAGAGVKVGVYASAQLQSITMPIRSLYLLYTSSS